ncbi:MAG: 1-acyl-sn-glycerol-3-phosphate acyltransferase [candidate division KSB1 bacterium]|nr:1-acyl-sn-glycerol-3-phosphate acyltransferase [candidate division KSB1 bacterium]MDZ7275243.1 1-acyl-sn-glycerol-3-phosphate acyltransferase [candidate division KSB1 bacterium]MDZ7287411.1 1-acyl-sn-glycerol-3-phosphate acyltransferase [candidate division KSB1 bacterium]MDZ7299525.1 1-acyl-sn-glycerol-3-phosphate acyltransferase [candidate division KSB1 bacterium]MDZ7305430.1 1-acyl-sn-glycerol-3-phosphate acyltransferase [candidate division KSB1 bacterium]
MQRLIFRLSQLLLRIYFSALFRLEVRGRANIPRHGRLLIAANHISGYDPPLVGCLIPRVVHFMAKKELFRIPLLGPLIRFYNAIPTDRTGTSLSTVRRVSALLAAEEAVLVFPEGTRVRSGRLGAPKAGVGMLAVRNHTDILPVHLDGLQKRRGFGWRRPRVKVVFGERLAVANFLDNGRADKEVYLAVTAAVNARIAQLAASCQE